MSERAANGPGIPSEAGGTRSEAPGDPAGVTPPPSPALRAARWRAAPAVAVVVAAAVYAWLASATTPFTVPADVTTAVPLAGMVTAVALQRVRPDRALWRRIPADRPPGGGSAAPWLFLLVLLVVPEGVSLLASGARSSHPTISFLTDTLFHWHAAKAAVYFLWLWLCWYFVRR